jgi:hypothetical protein
VTFEGLVDRLQALFDVGQQRCVDVANERLGRLVADSTGVRAIVSLGTTSANVASYTLAANVVKVLKVQIVFSAGTAIYEGTATLEEFWELTAGNAYSDGYFYAVEPDADTDATTDNLRLYPAPTEAGKTISGLVALRPAVLTYTSNTALPIAVNFHPALLAGCEAELYDEDDRQDEAAKKEQEFLAGVQGLKGAVNARAKGTGRHRMRISGYDLPRRG